MLYSFHDHIVDFIVEKLDEKIIGMENVFRGLNFVMQWDEIIKSQRRYAFLTWPDVQPSSLLHWSAKMMEVKWAAIFNLTVENMRSSLGLTIMHIVMFSAGSEVARWLMLTYPNLLLVKDSQNDTPVTIALKGMVYSVEGIVYRVLLGFVASID